MIYGQNGYSLVSGFEASAASKIADGAKVLFVILAALLSATIEPAMALRTPQRQEARVQGVVRDSKGNPLAGALVLLQGESQSNLVRTHTDAEGTFVFASLRAGTYAVKVEKAGFKGASEDSIKLAPAETKQCEFVLQTLAQPSDSSTATEAQPSGIELDDRPNFTVAGITDSTGSGGHGSETRMRTGEGLARETLNLESGKPTEASVPGTKTEGIDPKRRASEDALRAAVQQDQRSFEANRHLGEFYLRSQRYLESISPLAAAYQLNPEDHQNAFDLALAYKTAGEATRARAHVDQMLVREKDLSKQEEASLRHLLGDLDETLGDPLGAVKEDERATTLDGSEENYFAWGAELLLHKAAVPAIEVFSKGVRAHPDSARMLAGLGAGLYTSGSVDDAAERLCEASDLEPANPAPYLFLGKMQEATSTPLPCAEEKLSRFLHNQPDNPLANYYYALALWKRSRSVLNSDALQQAETLLGKATALDPKLDAAYLALGNLYFARGSFQEAVGAYEKAIAANPTNSEAHYRLGLAYKKIGEDGKSEHEFTEYKELDKTEAAAVERQRRELRQFVFVLKDQPGTPRSTADKSLSK
jgi:tetratricopeptide (TPR) repeat protein